MGPKRREDSKRGLLDSALMCWFRTGACFAFLAVVLGAFGAHGLRHSIPADRLEVYETGVFYHAVHALGLLLAASCGGVSDRARRASGAAFVAGIALFSGSLYLLAVTGERWLGMITPFGGVAFLVGWGVLVLARTRPAADSTRGLPPG